MGPAGAVASGAARAAEAGPGPGRLGLVGRVKDRRCGLVLVIAVQGLADQCRQGGLRCNPTPVLWRHK